MSLATPATVFAERRRRLLTQLDGPALLGAGWPRCRNFPHREYPFRAESHFLYLVGAQLPRAALYLSDGRAVVYAPAPDPRAALWTGPSPSLAELGERLGVEIQALESLACAPGTATLPSPDARSSAWLEAVLGRPVGLDGTRVTGPDAALADALIALRLRHDPAAIAQIRAAAAVTRLAHLRGMEVTREGMLEARLRAEMDVAIVGHGLSHAYEPIVTCRGEVLHEERQSGALGPHDLVLADVGAESPEGWASDVTRVWPVSGRFSPTQRELYQVVLTAQRAAIAAVRPGARFRDVHHTAQRALVSGLVALGILRGDPDELHAMGAAARFFPHGVGHLLGLDVHDLEDLGDRAGYAPGRTRSPHPGDRYLRLDRDLEPGMVVTIEPGFYRLAPELTETTALDWAVDTERLAHFDDVRGLRLEDDVLVTESGSEVLTREIPIEPEAIEAACGARRG